MNLVRVNGAIGSAAVSKTEGCRFKPCLARHLHMRGVAIRVNGWGIAYLLVGWGANDL